MTTLIKYTHDEVNDRELAHVGVKGRPNPWWPGGQNTNDCVGYQTERLGLRTGHETLGDANRYSEAQRKLLWLGAHPHFISISAFRLHYQFHEVPPEQIKAGNLVLSNWSGDRNDDGVLIAEHMEYCYSIRTGHESLVIIGANTGPVPGIEDPNGVWRKTRPLDEHIVGGIVLPFADPRPSLARRHEVQVVAAYVNTANEDMHLGLTRTTAADPGPDRGIEGHNYRLLVQTVGRHLGWYPSPYVIDGVFGPRSRIVEAALYKAATAKK